MKNVCLISYSHSNNYGASLQLFATYKYLEKIGCKVKILNYKNRFEAASEGLDFLFQRASIKLKLKWFISGCLFGSIKNGKDNFRLFYESMQYTPPVQTAEELSMLTDFDIFCVGSDQVWNANITNGYDEIFCLNNNQIDRKISFSSSMGSLNGRQFDSSILFNSLKSFESIAVREHIAKQYIESNINKDVKVTVDPTLLFTYNEWNELLKLEQIENLIREKYVLIYALGGAFENNNVIARKIANIIGAKTAVITLSNRPKKVDYLLNHVTPAQFVKLISNAAFVVTNSFHGTCFAFIYNIPFYSVRYGANPARAEELLIKYGLSERIYKDDTVIKNEILDNIDLKAAREKLKDKKEDSEMWLKKAVYGSNI